jgi:RNA polymerase sigma-70 factor (ECF subfamily)
MRNNIDTQSDSPEEFLRLLGQHEAALREYILALAINWSDADDIAQETRMRLWQQFGKYDRSKDFGVWARSIAHFLVLAHRKAATRKRQFSDRFIELMRHEADLLRVHDHGRREALSGCLEKLTEPQRNLIADCYAPRSTIKDVAVRLGRSIRGLQLSVARIRALLQECVQRVVEREGRNG